MGKKLISYITKIDVIFVTHIAKLVSLCWWIFTDEAHSNESFYTVFWEKFIDFSVFAILFVECFWYFFIQRTFDARTQTQKVYLFRDWWITSFLKLSWNWNFVKQSLILNENFYEIFWKKALNFKLYQKLKIIIIGNFFKANLISALVFCRKNKKKLLLNVRKCKYVFVK